MRADNDLPPSLKQLGEQLYDAACREVRADRRPQRGPRVAIAALVGLLLVAAAAAAATLIATGSLLHDHPDMPRQLQPATPRGNALAVSVRDREAGGEWAVRIYTSRNGYECAVAGRVRGSSLGLVEHARFRPYALDVTGACGDLTRSRFFLSITTVTEPVLRTLVYGRAQHGVDRVEINVAGSMRFARPGPGGAFLIVLTGRHSLAELRPRA